MWQSSAARHIFCFSAVVIITLGLGACTNDDPTAGSCDVALQKTSGTAATSLSTFGSPTPLVSETNIELEVSQKYIHSKVEERSKPAEGDKSGLDLVSVRLGEGAKTSDPLKAGKMEIKFHPMTSNASGKLLSLRHLSYTLTLNLEHHLFTKSSDANVPDKALRQGAAQGVILRFGFEKLRSDSANKDVAHTSTTGNPICNGPINKVDEAVLGAVIDKFYANPQSFPVPADKLIELVTPMLGREPALVGSTFTTGSNGLKVGFALDPGKKLRFDSTLWRPILFEERVADWSISIGSDFINTRVRTQAAETMSRKFNVRYVGTDITYGDKKIDIVVSGTTIPNRCEVYGLTSISFSVATDPDGVKVLRAPQSELVTKTGPGQLLCAGLDTCCMDFLLGEAKMYVGQCRDVMSEIEIDLGPDDLWYGVDVASFALDGTPEKDDGMFVIGGRSSSVDRWLQEHKLPARPSVPNC